MQGKKKGVRKKAVVVERPDSRKRARLLEKRLKGKLGESSRGGESRKWARGGERFGPWGETGGK